MTEKITLRAKSDGTEIRGELVEDHGFAYDVRLARGVEYNIFSSSEWDRVYTLPTKPGTVFRATVRGVENVRLMVRNQAFITGDLRVGPWHDPEHIDASTIVIELEGEEQ